MSSTSEFTDQPTPVQAAFAMLKWCSTQASRYPDSAYSGGLKAKVDDSMRQMGTALRVQSRMGLATDWDDLTRRLVTELVQTSAELATQASLDNRSIEQNLHRMIAGHCAPIIVASENRIAAKETARANRIAARESAQWADEQSERGSTAGAASIAESTDSLGGETSYEPSLGNHPNISNYYESSDYYRYEEGER